jgi:hypothetical protein
LEPSTPEQYAAVEAQLRECFGRVIYTHKTHEKDAERCAKTLKWFKIVQIILAGLTTSGLLAILFTETFALKAATAVVSLVSLMVTNYMKGFDPGAAAQKHRDTAADLLAIREAYLSLLVDAKAKVISLDLVRERRDMLQGRLEAIYKSAPHTTPKAYALAQAALQKNEDYTFNDGEIDTFLPVAMRKGEDSGL